ncbi:MAG: GIY-YIG nuclease family protein, partial [Bacteroidales bacterium]|nr:GIY-YIG nuclease family protein [Bacteroidales bacterium]
FKSYHDTVITYEDLKMIFEKNSQTWKTKLEAVNCIYLIQDTKNGKQYIGSTYGREGIWGRWKEYAKSGHGGNTELVNLVEQNNKSMYDFHWVILETLSINVTAYEAIEREALYKFKFQTIKFGYNLN